MKKLLIILSASFFSNSFAQFKVSIDTDSNFSPKEAYVYTLDGSKDILLTKQNRKGNTWAFSVSKPYTGMMKIFFPENNTSTSFISENKDVKFKIISKDNKISDVEYLDEANKLMNAQQDMQQKKEYILPALYQIKEYYKDNTEFGAALNKEILSLSGSGTSAINHPFVNYYLTNYSKFLVKDASKAPVTEVDIKDFIVKSNDLLETSSLLRPLLVAYLNTGSRENVDGKIQSLITALNLETSRGQTVLSELIDIFDVYGMEELKAKYLTEAKNLKCTINDRLSSTIATNANTEIGAKFQNNKFINPTNTTAKSLYDVKASKKVVVFWSSTCSHCEKDLPDLIAKYAEMKKQNIEIIGLSLDSDKVSYQNKIKDLPWINDSELKGWYSSYGETYNVHATPTYFVLDSDNKIIAKPNHAKDVLEFLKLK